MKAASTILVAALLAGCAGPAHERLRDFSPAPELLARSDRGEPLTTIALSDGWTWPHRLLRIVVVLDGAVLHEEKVSTAALDARPDRSSRVLEQLALPRGWHTLQVLAVANYASTRIDGRDGCHVDVRAHKSFDVGGEPVAVQIELATGGLIERFDERVDVNIDVSGARGEESLHTDRRAKGPEFACSDALPLPFDDDYIEAMRQGPGCGVSPR